MNIRWLFIEGGSLIAPPSTPLESGGRPLLDAMGVKERESLALERKKIWDGLARGDHQEAQSTLFNIQ